MLQEGRPPFESVVELLADIAGVPESSEWDARWCGLPGFLGADPDSPSWRGEGLATWRDISIDTRDSLFEALRERWESEGLYVKTKQDSVRGELWVELEAYRDDPATGEPPALLLLPDNEARHLTRGYPNPQTHDPVGTFELTVEGTGPCFTWEDLRSTGANSG